MTSSMDSFKTMRDELDSFPHNESIMQWKDNGEKVMGWICNYVPEEIIYAAGILPVRIIGHEDFISRGDSYLQSNMCPYIRGCLGLGLDKKYDFLDGIIAAHSCDAVCRLFDNWRLYIGASYSHLLDHPHKISETSQKYHYQQLEKLKKSLEDFSGQEITDTSLKEAIDIYNENRTILKQIHHLMARENPPLTGVKLSEIVRSSMIMPKDQNNLLLKKLYDELMIRDGDSNTGPRLMISGSIMDNSSFIKLIEDCGATVVADDLCSGTRYFWDNVENNEDPLTAIGLRYLNLIPCACIEPPFPRFDFMFDLIEEYKVDGVILYGLMFCDTFQYDFVGQRKRLEEKDIPVLEVEIEHPSLGLGQLETRVQAFLEML
ncbi:MAG: 2-hydroxyacyl-CoA dehydratase family protein [Thermodesulfobacteriota bacterium]|nr:2-hydroxyacyl-CoA dehydratase family protein [Thermodesulfobacteriota bacterium]